MNLSELLSRAHVPSEALEGPDVEVAAVVADSRAAQPGSLFVAMPSRTTDTSQFVAQAVQNGAHAVVGSTASVREASRRHGVPFVLIPDEGAFFNASLGLVCRALLGDPTSNMRVVGITGTNGKTTTAWMLADALRALGRKAAYMGTLGFRIDGHTEELANTTPFPVELWTLLKRAADSGVEDFVMESSSHALVERRLAGVRFDVGSFTNLTQDHLDFHGTMEAYAAAKLLLFTEYAMASDKPFVGVLNTDEAVAQDWLGQVPCRTVRYGRQAGAWRLEALEVGIDSIRVRLPGGAEASCRVGGLFNVGNLTTTGATLLALGCSEPEIGKGLASVTPAPGRFEPVPNDHGIGVLVDYAHTPDALEKLLGSVRDLHPRRVISVFGCGGDRDRTKRPIMGRVASTLSDVAIVTSDNPRTEDPQAIVRDVESGLAPGSTYVSILDRVEAIHHAVRLAESGDVVVIAGKGHENYQIVGRTKHPMDDRLIARDALEARR